MGSFLAKGCALLVAVIVGSITVTAQAADRIQDRRTLRPSSSSTASSSTMVELLLQLDALQSEVRELRNQIEIQQHELKRLKTQQIDLLRDVDKRLSRIEKGGNSNISLSTPPAPTISPKKQIASGGKTAKKSSAKRQAAPRKTASSNIKEQKEYDQAFGYMKLGHYNKASKSFRSFLTKHPKSKLAGNAQYWVAEANYVVSNYKLALEEFQKVVKVYPKSTKVSDARLKIGMTYYALQNWDQAKKTFSDVVKRYPKSRVARKAKERLAAIKKEGH